MTYTEKQMKEILRNARLDDANNIRIQNGRIEALLTEVAALRWAVRGLCSERARVGFHLNTEINPNKLWSFVLDVGRQCACVLAENARIAFKDHGRVYTMHRYIRYLQEHARSQGVSFTELGEDNDGHHDIFNAQWNPRSFELDEVTKQAEGKSNG